MSEEAADSPSSAEPATSGVDPVAMGIAMGRASAVVDEEVVAYLRDQRHHLHEQFKHLREQIRLGIWEKRLGVLLRIATAFTGLAVAAGLAFMIWNAAHDDGLVVEAFSVPPDLTAQGQTGQVVAAQLLDGLSYLLANSNSGRLPSSYSNNWGGDLKVEIPETGISIGEFDNYLHRLLGHQTHISGEVVHTPTGLAITVRAGVDGSARVTGSDLDKLVQWAAEAVYRQTQPYRYGVFLIVQGRRTEAQALFEQNAASGPVLERAWANGIGLPNIYGPAGNSLKAYEAAETAVRLKPDFAFGWNTLAGRAPAHGKFERALEAARTELRLLDSQTDLRPEIIPRLRFGAQGSIATLLGDYDAALQDRLASLQNITLSDPPGRILQEEINNTNNISNIVSFPVEIGLNRIDAHDLPAARRISAQAGEYVAFLVSLGTSGRKTSYSDEVSGEEFTQMFRWLALQLALADENFPAVRKLASDIDSNQPHLAAVGSAAPIWRPTQVWPLAAEALAREGDFKTAHALIDKTPADCDPCLRTRAKIDELEKNYGGADYWFELAVKAAPSIPFAYTEWGKALKERGDFTGAIAKFTIANQKGPHFADPLEMWGEVLIAQNRSDLAISKFKEAEKYAPNWGRLHLKWGEALSYLGKTADAQKQFARAAELDLTAAEKTQLATVRK